MAHKRSGTGGGDVALQDHGVSHGPESRIDLSGGSC